MNDWAMKDRRDGKSEMVSVERRTEEEEGEKEEGKKKK